VQHNRVRTLEGMEVNFTKWG